MAAVNERGAGRKKTLNNEQIKALKERFNQGETISALAKEAGVSRQTLSGYFNAKSEEERIYELYTTWARLNSEFRRKQIADYTLRIDYMNGEKCCSVILVDFLHEQIAVVNKTADPLLKAFGVKVNPAWPDFQGFLEERCIPKERHQVKQVLRDLGVDGYDTLAILEKTQGRTGEDGMWLKFSYFRSAE